MWDYETRSVAREAKLHCSAITCVAWSRSGRLLAAGASYGCVALWDVASGEVVR